MTQGELKRKLEGLVSTYFSGAVVSWGSVKSVTSSGPAIVLSMGVVRRPLRPIRGDVEGVPTDCYPAQTTIQVDLYTKGAKRKTKANVMAAAENTAINDMLAFLGFINSPMVDEWCLDNDISLLVSEAHDLTETVNDTSWEYRAMAEIEVGFTEYVIGYSMTGYESGRPIHDTGIPKYDDEGYALDEDGVRLPGDPLPADDDGKPIYPPVAQTPSGGGSQELADQFTGWFGEVEGPTNRHE